MNKKRIFSLVSFLLLLAGCYSSRNIKSIVIEGERTAAEAELIHFSSVRTAKEPLVLVHYMPWFQAPPVSDSYGFHWHQGGGGFDPYEVLDKGYANIASHYYPLTGPYDTRDKSILEYQAALFKIAGIDGVIFDWYGIEDSLDYGLIHDSTLNMIEVLKRAGLKYMICYEDQSIGKMIEAGAFTKSQSVEYGKKVFQWMDEHWFSDESYVTHNGRPVVMCFGPQYFKDEQEWTSIFSECIRKPYFIGLESHSEGFTEGSYNWFNMNGTKTYNQLVDQLNAFYDEQQQFPYLIATAFPSFHDIYSLSGQKSYGFLDYSEGKTFNLSLGAALQSNPDIIQIATWNDYGEGTMVEPTAQRGYRELEVLQDLQKNYDDDFSYNHLDLRAPLTLYSILTDIDSPKTKSDYAKKALISILDGHIQDYKKNLKEGSIVLDFSARPLIKKTLEADVPEQISVFNAEGRANEALGAPVVVNNFIYEFTGSKSTDGDTKTYWEGKANSFPNILTADIISPCLIDCVVLKLNPQRIWGARTQEIEIQLSSNGSTYLSAVGAREYVFSPEKNQNTVVIPIGLQARYVRIIFSKNTGGTAGQLAELEVYRFK